jgi:hypothetical protein
MLRLSARDPGTSTASIPPRYRCEDAAIPAGSALGATNPVPPKETPMRNLRHATALAALALLASCSEDDPSSATEAPPTQAPDSSESETAEPDYTVLEVTPRYGPGRWALTARGDQEAPIAVFDVPQGVEGRENLLWVSADTFANLMYAAPSRVPSDPCDHGAPSEPLGPTVEDLATALAAQKRTTATAPAAAELGGYRGLYLELTVDRADLRRCPDGLLIWQTADAGDDRVLESPSTDRYWILDLGDRRVVLNAMSEAPSTDDVVATLVETTESVTFVAAGN